MAIDDILNSREWDVLLPTQCRNCSEVNCELNSGQQLFGKLLGQAAVNEACSKLIDYVEVNCPGLDDQNNPDSCPSWPAIKLINFIELPPAPTDIVDR